MASGECEDRAGLHGRRTVGMSLLLLQPELCLYDELPVDEHAQELDHIVPKRPQRMRVRVRVRGGAARGPKGHRTAPRADALVMFSRCGVSRSYDGEPTAWSARMGAVLRQPCVMRQRHTS